MREKTRVAAQHHIEVLREAAEIARTYGKALGVAEADISLAVRLETMADTVEMTLRRTA